MARTLQSCRRQSRHPRLLGRPASSRLNRVLRGWGNYFQAGNSARKFAHIDSYVHERLALLASAKHGRTGRHWATRYNGEWRKRLGAYTLTGTVRYRAAHAPR